MAKYSVGDHVSWNSEAGLVSGKIIKVHHHDLTTRVIDTAHRNVIRNMIS